MITSRPIAIFPGLNRGQVITLVTNKFVCGEFSREVLAFREVGRLLWCVERLSKPVERTFISCYELSERGGDWGYVNYIEGHGIPHCNCPLEFMDLAPVRDTAWRRAVREFHTEAA